MSSPAESHRRYSNEPDVYSKAEVYYADRSAASRKDPRNRTFSARVDASSPPVEFTGRRYSVDDTNGQGRKFLIPVPETLEALLANEDTDKNSQITIEDLGPKVYCEHARP